MNTLNMIKANRIEMIEQLIARSNAVTAELVANMPAHIADLYIDDTYNTRINNMSWQKLKKEYKHTIVGLAYFPYRM